MNSNPTTSSTEPEAGSIKTLLQELRGETSRLLQKEAELARAEFREKASRLGGHVTRMGIGGFIAYAGLIVALIGLGDLVAALLINADMNPTTAGWIGRLGVGFLVALTGWIMLTQARKAVKSDDLVPEQTLESMRENKLWMQTKLQHSHESL